MGHVIDAVDEGHIASDVAEHAGSAQFTPKSTCKKCLAAWPCDTIRYARGRDIEASGRKR